MQESSADVASLILGEVSKLLRSITSQEVEDLINGDATLQVHYTRETGSNPPVRASMSDSERAAVISAVSVHKTREAGDEYLQSLKLTRNSLVTIARELGIPVQKADNVARVREKIIESAIGARLRSRAIRGQTPGI